MRLRRPSAPPEGENVLPMINVVFLLLIFFMIAGAIERADLFDVSPPAAAGARQAEDGGGVLLMAADGRLALDGAEVSRDGLGEALAAFLEARPGAVVKVKADARTEALEVVALLEDLREAGVEKVVLLATEEDA